MIKILAVSDNGGGGYHRVKLPLQYLNKKEFTVHFLDYIQLEEDMVKGYDIIYIHYVNPCHHTNLSLWKVKYGFKIVVDVDDSLKIPNDHINYKKLQSVIPIVRDYIILADLVIVPTIPLFEEFSILNNNVQIVQNSLPYGEGQFNITSNESEKIRIGICGSISHINDWFSIANQIRKIVKDPNINKKAEFYVCGASPDGEWKRIVNLFEGVALVRFNQPIESYMKLYEDLDILLAPLEHNQFNIAKSSLKIQEAACKNVLVIGSELYQNKGDFCYYPDDIASYFTMVKKLVKDIQFLRNIKKEFSEHNRNQYLFKETIELREEIIKTL